MLSSVYKLATYIGMYTAPFTHQNWVYYVQATFIWSRFHFFLNIKHKISMWN